MRLLSTLLLLLVGCSGGDDEALQGPATIVVGGDDDDDDDTGTDAVREHLEHLGSTECGTPYDGPVIFDEASVACGGQDQVRFELRTFGWTTGGLVYVVNTAEPGVHDEEHTLWIVDYDPCGLWDDLHANLDAGVDAWEVDRSTAFTCDEHFQAAPAKLTYAARAYDLDGNFADCITWGHDPFGLAGGDYDSSCVNCPSRPAELRSCFSMRSAL